MPRFLKNTVKNPLNCFNLKQFKIQILSIKNLFIDSHINTEINLIFLLTYSYSNS